MSILNLGGPVERQPGNKRAVKVWIGIALLAAVLGIGSTLAANITINGGTNQEFGQGVQGTVYCGAAGERPITINALSTFDNSPVTKSENSTQEVNDDTTGSLGNFFLSGIQVSDIDPACSGVDFVFSIYDDNGVVEFKQIIPGQADQVFMTNPTVFWFDPTLPCDGSGSTKTALSQDDCNLVRSKATPGLNQALFSSKRSTWNGAEGIAGVNTDSTHGFTIKFEDSIVKILTNHVGKIVVETQNDTFGVNAITPDDGYTPPPLT